LNQSMIVSNYPALDAQTETNQKVLKVK